MVKVVKFGGTSLADASAIKNVANIIKSDEARRYVVPSAPGKRFNLDIKVTDLLYAAYDSVGTDQFEENFAKITDRFNEIIFDLGIQMSLKDEYEIIKENFNKQLGREYAASRGEYLNGQIIAQYLGYEFVDASQVIFIDDDGNNIDDYTDHHLTNRLKGISHAVIPGFYGSGKDGKIKTFSRGGSDITGSIVAKAVNADLYENWTDVSGMLVADPRIVDHPRSIPLITYTELRELSYMGASVLHENAVFPVRKNGIPINIKNTFKPEDPGTMIVETTAHKPDNTITGVAGKKGFTAITIEKGMMNSQIGFARKVLTVFEENGLSIEHMPSGIDTLTVVVNTDDFVKCEQNVLAGLHRAVDPDHIELESDLSLIAVVGRGMKESRGCAGKIFQALGKARVNVKMIDQGSSELNIICGVKSYRFEEAIRAIYDAFNNESSN